MYLFIFSNSLLLEFIYIEFCHENSDSFTSSTPIWIPTRRCSCSFPLAWLSITMLTNSGESGHPSLISDFTGKVLFFTIEYDIILLYPFYCILVINRCCILSNAFLQLEVVISFSYFLLMIPHSIDWFVKMLNHPSIPGMNPTWSYVILLMYSCIWLSCILFRIFALMFITDIGL